MGASGADVHFLQESPIGRSYANRDDLRADVDDWCRNWPSPDPLRPELYEEQPGKPWRAQLQSLLATDEEMAESHLASTVSVFAILESE